ncbi:MAG: hypothetical protein ACRDRJ_10740 [Streptosporangiaceae bacterium]
MPGESCDPEDEAAAGPEAAEWPPAADYRASAGYPDDGFVPDADYADAGFTAAADYSDAGFLAAEPQLADPAPAEPPPAEAGMTPAEARTAEPRTAEPRTAEPPAVEPPARESLTTEASATDATATQAPPTEAPATEAPATEAPATEAPPSPAKPGLSGQLTRLRAPLDRLRQPRDPDRPQGRGARLLRYGRRSIGPVAFVVLGILLYTAYLAQSRTIPATSESGGQALQAWNMLHGNFLLSGWTMSDVSFYTTELPEYMLVEWIHGLNSDTVHVAAALSYTLIVLLGGLLARGGPKGRATGREGLIRFFIAAGIMLAPPLTNTSLLLGNPDHTGTHAPLLLIFLVLDRAPRKWWTPVLITIMLTWAQMADTLVLYEAAIPIALAGLLRANRRRGPLAGNWFDLSLTVGAAISAVAAKHILTLIKDSGGFIVKNPNVRFTTVKALPQGIFTDFARMLDVFGAKFFGMKVGSDATDTLLKLIGVALVIWAVAAALRRLYRADADLIVQVLSIGFVILLAAYVLGTKNDENEIVGLLPLGAVLAGRVLTAPIIRNKLVPALAIVLVIYAGMLGSNALRPAHQGRAAEFGAWLNAHHLVYGLGNFWNSTNTTVSSGGQVRVRPVRTFEDRIVTTLSESSGEWYDAHHHYANFIVSSRWWTCKGVCVGLHSVRQSFGPPAVTYSFRDWRILVYNKNLLARLRTENWCNEGWPWNTPKTPSPTACRS